MALVSTEVVFSALGLVRIYQNQNVECVLVDGSEDMSVVDEILHPLFESLG